MIWEGHAVRIGEMRYSQRMSSLCIAINKWNDFKITFAKTGCVTYTGSSSGHKLHCIASVSGHFCSMEDEHFLTC
jgi:hypothetical protein